MQAPEGLLYTSEHAWIELRGGTRARIGITDYAQDELGEIVYVELPMRNRTVSTTDLIVEIESAKSMGEVHAPFDGMVLAINESLRETPELVNSQPYGDGWLVEMDAVEIVDVEKFLDATAYLGLTE